MPNARGHATQTIPTAIKIGPEPSPLSANSTASVRKVTQGLFPQEQREAASLGIFLITDETER